MHATAAWIDGATEQTVAWDVGAVLSTVAHAADDDLLQEILLQLPAGYDLLFGHPVHLTPTPGDRTPATTTPVTERQRP